MFCTLPLCRCLARASLMPSMKFANMSKVDEIVVKHEQNEVVPQPEVIVGTVQSPPSQTQTLSGEDWALQTSSGVQSEASSSAVTKRPLPDPVPSGSPKLGKLDVLSANEQVVSETTNAPSSGSVPAHSNENPSWTSEDTARTVEGVGRGLQGIGSAVGGVSNVIAATENAASTGLQTASTAVDDVVQVATDVVNTVNDIRSALDTTDRNVGGEHDQTVPERSPPPPYSPGLLGNLSDMTVSDSDVAGGSGIGGGMAPVSVLAEQPLYETPSAPSMETPRSRRFRKYFGANPGAFKYGDHSVTTEGSAPKLLMEVKPDFTVKVNFCQVWMRRAEAFDDQIAYVPANNAVTIESILYSNEVGGGLGPGVHRAANILHTQAAPIAFAVRDTLTLGVGAARKEGEVDKSKLKEFLTGGLPTDRQLGSFIFPTLNPANDPHLGKRLANDIFSASVYYDTSAMYAKLVYLGLLRELYDYVGAVPGVAAAWAGAVPNYINIDVPAAGVNAMRIAITNALASGDIIFVHRSDYEAEDAILLWILTTTNSYFEGPPAGPVPHATYIHFPSTNVTVLHHGAPPAVPALVDIPASRFYGFAHKLATSRSEHRALMRGLYIALDLIGVEYQIPAGAGLAQPILADLRLNGLQLAKVYDYNFMYRIIGLTPELDIDAQIEWQAFMGANSGNDRVRLAAIYNGALSVLTAQVFAAYNIVEANLQNWLTGAAAVPPMVGTLLGQTPLTQPKTPGTGEALIISQTRAMFDPYFGAGVCVGLYAGQQWNKGRGQQPAANIAFQQIAADVIPCKIDQLALDDFIEVRPLEWCLPGPNTKPSMKAEVTISGPAAQQGWYSTAGTDTYAKAVMGIDQTKLRYYGILAMNTITSAIRPAIAPVVNAQVAVPAKGRQVSWAIGPAPIAVGGYDPILHVILPGHFTSYNHVLTQVQAPCLVGGAGLPAQFRRQILQWGGDVVERVGFALPGFRHEMGTEAAVDIPPELLAMMGELQAGEEAPSTVTSKASAGADKVQSAEPGAAIGGATPQVVPSHPQ